MTAIIFIIVLAVLIFVHELGHFLTARWCGVRIDAFKIGFGPKIFAWTRGETEYGVNLIPFGGYVKIHGENPDEESLNGPDAHRSFVNKPRWKQAIVLAAGVIFNFIFAWIIYCIVFMSGVTATKDGFERYVDRFTNERVMITYISPQSPAEREGLRVGDSIIGVLKPASVSTNDSFTTATSTTVGFLEGGVVPIEAIQQFIDKSAGKILRFYVTRNGTEQIISVTPKTGIVEGKYAVGISMQQVGDLSLGPVTSVIEGSRYVAIMIRETAAGLFGFIINIFHGSADFSDVSGPIGIAGIVGDAAHLGFTYLMMVIALISINLGVINLIPFPALDGGRLLFVAIEGITRRRIPMKFFTIVNMAGFALLMALMVLVTYKDLAKLFR